MKTRRADPPPWCGTCTRATRLRLVQPDPGDPAKDYMTRCEHCHPAASGGCGKHAQPPGRTCDLCAAGIK